MSGPGGWRRYKKHAALALLFVGVGVGGLTLGLLREPPAGTAAPPSPRTPPSARAAFEAGRSGVWLRAEGRVVRLLRDDLKGKRHQRFVIALPDGLTLLISHNIDLAPRVPAADGDGVEVFGRYEWNRKGGVIHWTHRDPKNQRPGGWIRHKGRVYR